MHEMRLVCDWHHCDKSMHELNTLHHTMRNLFITFLNFFDQKLSSREHSCFHSFAYLVLWELSWVSFPCSRESMSLVRVVPWVFALKFFLVLEDEPKKRYKREVKSFCMLWFLDYNQFSLSSFCIRINFGWSIGQEESILILV